MWKMLYSVCQFMTIICSYCSYRVLRMIVTSIQRITECWRRIHGNSDHNAGNRLGYDVSAHIYRIILRKKFFEMNISSANDFLGVHSHHAHPKYVLKPNVSLYCLSQKEAIFVEIGDEEHNSIMEKAPFLYMDQFRRAKNVISLPYWSFQRLAEDVGDPVNPVVWISSTGRCGSTLLGQIFARIPETKMLSEPDVFTNLGYLSKSKAIQTKNLKDIFRSCVRILCRTENRNSLICLKTRSCCSKLMTLIGETFPDIHQVFLYRDALPTVSSFFGLLISEPLPKLVRYLADSRKISRLTPVFRKLMYFYFCYAIDFERSTVDVENTSTGGFMAHSWALCVRRCEEAIGNRHPVLTLLYEDLLNDRVGTCSKLFLKLGINQSHVSSAMGAFAHDAQEGSVLSRRHIENKSQRALTEAMKRDADSILPKYGLSKLGERYEIQGSL